MSAPDAFIADRYRVRRRVGTGGMGVVWEGWDERLHRTVAIKQLHPQPGLSPVDAEIANQRAMREARITARLHHRFAVSVFDVVEHEGQPCLVMEFVPSKPLSEILRERGPIPPRGAARMGAQISSALAAAHRVGIVHRDVKPGNVLIAEDGTARISDFGISHALGDVTLTTTGMVSGTPAFLAPEVARGGEATFASDVFSLGATLYAAVEGVPPFGAGQNPMALLHRVALGEVTTPSRSGPLTALLLQMLSKEPTDRPSMGEVAHQLNAFPYPGAGHEEGTVELAATTPLAPVTADQPGSTDQPESTDRAVHAARTGQVTPAGPITPAGPVTSVGPAAAATIAGTAHWAMPGSTADAGTDQSGEPPRRSRRLLWTLAAVVLLLGVAALAATFIPGARQSAQPGPDTASQAPAPSPSPQESTGERSTPAPTRSSSAPPSPTRETSSAPPSPTKETSSAPPSRKPSPSSRTRSPSASASSPRASASESTGPVSGEPTAVELGRAITDYYALMPGGTDQAWSRMTASYQRNQTGGRAAYERFWAPIERVTVRGVRGTPPAEAVATVTYHFEDGRVIDEQTAYGLVADDGVLKINSSSVLNSSTR